MMPKSTPGDLCVTFAQLRSSATPDVTQQQRNAPDDSITSTGKTFIYVICYYVNTRAEHDTQHKKHNPRTTEQTTALRPRATTLHHSCLLIRSISD